jgi:hypothetical protein
MKNLTLCTNFDDDLYEFCDQIKPIQLNLTVFAIDIERKTRLLKQGILKGITVLLISCLTGLD